MKQEVELTQGKIASIQMPKSDFINYKDLLSTHGQDLQTT